MRFFFWYTPRFMRINTIINVYQYSIQCHKITITITTERVLHWKNQVPTFNTRHSCVFYLIFFFILEIYSFFVFFCKSQFSSINSKSVVVNSLCWFNLLSCLVRQFDKFAVWYTFCVFIPSWSVYIVSVSIHIWMSVRHSKI